MLVLLHVTSTLVLGIDYCSAAVLPKKSCTSRITKNPTISFEWGTTNVFKTNIYISIRFRSWIYEIVILRYTYFVNSSYSWNTRAQN